MLDSRGIQLIASEVEKRRDVSAWDDPADHLQTRGELAIAAACYAVNTLDASVADTRKSDAWHDAWPWPSNTDGRKTLSRERQLVIAGTLIAAEIDRMHLRAQEESHARRRIATMMDEQNMANNPPDNHVPQSALDLAKEISLARFGDRLSGNCSRPSSLSERLRVAQQAYADEQCEQAKGLMHECIKAAEYDVVKAALNGNGCVDAVGPIAWFKAHSLSLPNSLPDLSEQWYYTNFEQHFSEAGCSAEQIDSAEDVWRITLPKRKAL